MEAVGGPQTYVLGGAFNCGKAQPGQVAAVSPRLPVRAVPRRQHPQHHAGGRSMSRVRPSRTRSSSAPWSCPGPTAAWSSPTRSPRANLRWAGNALTTNGVTRGPHPDRRSPPWTAREGTASGVVSRSAVTADELEPLVRAAEAAARGRPGPAEDAQPLVDGRAARPPDFTDAPAETSSEVFADFAPGARRGVRPRPRRRPRAVRLRLPRAGLQLPGHLDRAAAAPRPADRARWSSTPSRRTGTPLGLGGRARPGTSRTSTRRRWTRSWRGGWAGPSAGSSCPPGGTRRCCRRPPSRT